VAQRLNFDTSGNLALPNGGIIYETNIPGGVLTGNTIVLKPQGGTNADQQLLVYPTAIGADFNHLHLTSGNLYNTELFLGNDDFYVKLANTGNVIINSNDDNGNTAMWTFDTTGNATFPANGTTALHNIIGNGLALFGQVHIGGNLTYAEDANLIIVENKNSFADIIAQNENPGGNASMNIVLVNDDPGNVYMAVGVNSSNFTPFYNTLFEIPNAGYVSHSTTQIMGPQSAESGESRMFFTYSSGSYALELNDHGAIGWGASYNGNLTQGNFGNVGQVLTSAGENSAPTWTNIPAPTVAQDITSNGAMSIMTYDGNLKYANYATVEPSTGNIAGGNISATGNITGAYFIGNGSQLTDVGVASVPSQNILPTIQSITIAATSNGGTGGGSGWANVTVANTIPVTEYGVIVTAGTISQKYVTGSLGSIPGTVQLSITTGLNTTPFTVYAYVTSNAGTYYSNSATGTSGICLLAETQIALSDGSYKAIEDITYTDKMLSWDFDRGCYAETSALWIKRGETGSQYNLLTFSDGTTLRTFDQHRIFNKQAGAFTYPMTDTTPIGTITVNEHGKEITLTNKQVIQDTIEYYNVITDYHMNLFSDSVLTSCRFNNIYPITDMKFVKDARILRTRDEFENVEYRFFNGLRLAEQTTDIETVEWYVNRLLSTEVLAQSELTV